ncbi:MAG: hypothetical protein ABIQ64_04600 [Candidatus Saccharimonadales bacterium]
MSSTYTYIHSAQLFAQSYSCGTYGADTYNQTMCETTQPVSGGLAYTGTSVWAAVATVVILIALPLTYYFVSFMKRRKQNKK